MNYIMTEEHKQKLRESNLGKKHKFKPGVLEKLSKLHKGKKLTKTHIQNISKGHINYYKNKDNRLKQSKRLTGRKQSELTKQKISNSNKGKKFTKESKQQISISLKEYLKNENHEHYTARLLKSIETKRRNNSFNKSKPEEDAYILLNKKFNKVHRQFSSELYPFACDFYIEDIQLYIECHFGWMHGKKPFTSYEDPLYIKWKSKNTPIYKQALYTWTDLDVRKLETFKANKLNYKIFYTYNEFLEWYNGEGEC